MPNALLRSQVAAWAQICIKQFLFQILITNWSSTLLYKVFQKQCKNSLEQYLFPQWITEKSSVQMFPMREIIFSDHEQTFECRVSH
jgi:hypothetical protein